MGIVGIVLEREIEVVRKQMYDAYTDTNSFVDEKVVRISQELDRLLDLWNKEKYNIKHIKKEQR